MSTTTTPVPTTDTTALQDLAAQLRVDSIRASTSAGSGHPTSSLSAADLLAVLMSRHLRYDWEEPDNPANDHLIFSKGHASPLIYSVFKAAGQVGEEELMTGYRRFGSRLQGHPTPVLPWVDVATGSLGQGLPDGVGIALAGKYLDKLPYRVWVLCGDSELAEGSIWEAVDKASHYQLDNVVAIVDVNRLGQRGPTELGWDLDAYARRFKAFGARVITIDGHDLAQIDAAMADAENGDGRPTVILARTVKGKGVPQIEDSPDWHGKPLPEEIAGPAIATLGGVRNDVVSGPGPRELPATPQQNATAVELPRYEIGQEMATRKAYGAALTAVGRADPKVVALDAEVSNSTGTGDFVKALPERYFEMYIAEQQLIGAATGLSVRGYKPFASTFAAFLTRAFDFVRMGAISQAALRIAGSHAGVEIGADGPSQMALEDLAMMRAVEGSTVLYPSDATSTADLVARMAATDGISYLRTTRGGYPVLYGSDESFPIGGSKVLRSGDQVTIVGAGVTVHQALAAAERLAGQGIEATVIDAYSVKPLDAATIAGAVRATGGRLVVAEDHHAQGGLGEAVLSGLAGAGIAGLDVAHLAVRGIPGSGTGAELLHWAGIDADGIVAAARRLIG
ncbi:transketolase [Acidipropionibacterium acidipropionici]|uniref:Transketolase n=1 Tax=Acidipropionibacterium acidipropionici TaxID=1748 RepID=A0AAC8YFY2_9ACTN|nr:transketolase [Acidipropionibacterium acidipropionici]AMS06021.1 transketolase [Acidipropionibacterium acidipropionici]AOZ47484.1 transketolase [Acidipropionibacterium acidipropionici]AZP39193.1 transketolase [Acidipropionibacterium acidipropionici]